MFRAAKGVVLGILALAISWHQAAMVVEDRLGEEAEKLGELLLPDVEMGHLFGEMIEQRRMMGEREDDGDGEAMS